MKAKQKNIRIFELEVEEESHFFDYMDKNIILLKEYLLLIKGELTVKMREYLEEKGTCFVEAESCPLKFSSKSDSDTIKEAKSTPTQEVVMLVEVEKDPLRDQERKTVLFDKPIRSGEEISHAGDVTIFGRVNSAAKVLCEGNVQVYGRIDGLVQCDGDYMIAKELGKGYIVFHGDILEKELFDGKLKKITHTKEGTVIKDIL